MALCAVFVNVSQERVGVCWFACFFDGVWCSLLAERLQTKKQVSI